MPETIGQQLKQARHARNLTFAKVTQATHIQARLLEAMEADDFESLPSPVQARAFLRIYADYLDLSLDDLIARQREAGGALPVSPSPLPAPVESQSPAPDADDVPPVAPANEPPTGKSRPLQERIKALFRKVSSRSETFSSPNEPTPVLPPLEPESPSVAVKKPADARPEKPKFVRPAEPASSGEARTSQTIFTGIGAALQQRREILSLTLDEIERHTHIRKHYLQALELGDFDHLPSSVQMRGMLNNYAHFLDMNVDTILLQFAEALQTQRLERQPGPVENTPSPEPKAQSRPAPRLGLRRYLSMDIIVGGGLILILLVLAVWGTSNIIGLRSATTPQPTAQSISDILGTMPVAFTATPTATSGTGTPVFTPATGATLVVTIPTAGLGPVQVVLVALEETYVRVTVDGKIQFDGRITGGNAYAFSGNTQIEVLTGSGSGVSVLYNQSNLGPMGTFGQVVDRIYTAKAILNPTATFTPSPTTTFTPTWTLRPGQLPLPTSTPLPPSNPTATRGGD